MATQLIQIRRGTDAQLTSYGAMQPGELGFTTDRKEVWVGDGSNNHLVGKVTVDTSGNKPSAGVSGRLYFETDTENMYLDDGSNWKLVGFKNLDSMPDGSTYGRVLQSELTSGAVDRLNDGSNIVTAAQARTHIDDATKHRVINDSGSGATDLWSASKIGSEISTAVSNVSAGDGLTEPTANTFAVGAGDGIDVSADAAAVDVTDFIDTSYGLTENTNDIRVNLDASGGLEFNAGAIRLEAAVAGNGLAHSSGVLSVNASGGVEVGSDYVRLASGVAGDGITNTAGVLSVNTSGAIHIAGDTLGLSSHGDAYHDNVYYHEGDTIKAGLGAAGTPSHTFTGDDNTGMFRPSADAIAFTNGGSESMRIDSSGNVGMGVSSLESWSATKTALQIGGNASIFGETTAGAGNSLQITQNVYNDGSLKYQDSDEATLYQQYAGTHEFRVAPSGTADAAVSFTTALKANNDGSVNLANGTTINEFSIDGTMAGNSDDAVPTEKAVKTYIDTSVLSVSAGDGLVEPSFNTFAVGEGNGLTVNANDVDIKLYSTSVSGSAGDASVNNNPLYLDSTNGLNVITDGDSIILDSANSYALTVGNIDGGSF